MKIEKFAVMAAAVFMLAAAGCVDVDYVGQKFPATPVSERLQYFRTREKMPQDVYRIIGRFTVTAREGTDAYDIEELLREKGREYGGDAVCLVSVEHVKVGAYTTNDDEFGAPSSADVNRANLNPDGTPIEINSFGQISGLKSESVTVTKVVVKALLLKKRSSLED